MTAKKDFTSDPCVCRKYTEEAVEIKLAKETNRTLWCMENFLPEVANLYLEDCFAKQIPLTRDNY
jgi:phosphoribosyl-ATP pyrophosphohydrolase